MEAVYFFGEFHMSFEKSDALAQERAGLRQTVKSSLAELEELRNKLKTHAAGSVSAETVDIGAGEDIVASEIAAARKELGRVEQAISDHNRAQSELDKAREEEANRLRTRNIMVGVGILVALIFIISIAGG